MTGNDLTFADLKAGHYRLEVRYRNNITGAVSPVYTLPIHLRPAWYATVTARVLYVLLGAALAAGLVLHYLRKYRRRRDEEQQRLKTAAGRRSTNPSCVSSRTSPRSCRCR